MMAHEKLVVIRGAGDLATGIAHRLWRCGFRLVLLEHPCPRVIRRTVSLAQAVFAGETQVEGMTGMLVTELPERQEKVEPILAQCWGRGQVPVLVDPQGESISWLKPCAVIDAIMAKGPTGTSKGMAPAVVAVGPGFTAGVDVDAVVETQRGHNLGRVILEGTAEPNTGIPGEVGGFTWQRLLRAPCAGIWRPLREIGDLVAVGDTVAVVDGQDGPRSVLAGVSGVLRGSLYPGLSVTAGMKVGDIDPRAAVHHCFTISDKARAVGGGVLEALLFLLPWGMG